MRLIRWSVEHPFTVFSAYALVLALGLLALGTSVPLRLNPSIESSQIAVLTPAPGLRATAVEAQVTNRLERVLAEVPLVRSIRSSSMDGMSMVILEFPYGHPIDSSLETVGNVVAGTELGVDSEKNSGHVGMGPRVLPYDPLRLPVVRLAVTAPQWDQLRLANVVEKELTQRLRRLPQVEAVWTFGAPRPEVAVAVDRDALGSLNLSLGQVRRAIDEAHSLRGAGTVTVPGSRSVPIELNSRPEKVQDLGSVVLTSQQGEKVRLDQVAQLSWGLMNNHSAYRYNGRSAIEVNVLEAADASSPRTTARVQAEMEQLAREYPGLTVEVAYDNAHFVGVLGQRVCWELALAVVLTGLVAYLFLGDWRGTAVVMATIPTTLACGILFFPLLGLSFNSSTLVGLLLAIGRLVDDTIIDLCAVERQRAQGKEAWEAAVEGCTGVRRAVISATVVIALVMLPLTMTGGLTQDMFEGIVWPYLVTLVASLLVALTLSPTLMAVLYQGVPPRPPSRGERWLKSLEARYRRLLAKALRWRGFVLGGSLASVYLALSLVPMLGWEMMPAADTGQLYVMLEARPGTSLEETTRMAGNLEAILRRQPEVQKISTEIGMASPQALSTGYAPMSPQMACMFVTLSDKGQRQRTLRQIADAAYVQAQLSIPNIRQLSIKEMGSDVMATSMSPVHLVIKGPDLERLAYLAEETKALAYRTETLAHPSRGLTQVGTTWSLESGARGLSPDPLALASLGLTASDLARQASAALDGELARTTLADGTPIKVSYQAQQRRSLDDLKAIRITGPGGSERLDRLAQIGDEIWPSQIEHEGLQRSNSVVAGYRPGGPGSMILGMEWLMASRMQLGLPPGYSIEQRGDMVSMMDSTRRLFGGMAVSLLLMYLALAILFRSVRLPWAIMAAIPVSLPGVFVALWLAQQTISTVSILGLAVLIGMDVTASILLLDAVTASAPSRTAWRPILQGAPSRLRPVLMTVLVTLVVLAPLAFFPGTGTDAYAPLATVIVGGLTVSCGLTLFLVPVLYSWLHRRPA